MDEKVGYEVSNPGAANSYRHSLVLMFVCTYYVLLQKEVLGDVWFESGRSAYRIEVDNKTNSFFFIWSYRALDLTASSLCALWKS